MAVFTVFSKITKKSLLRKSKKDLAWMVEEIAVIDNLRLLDKDQLVDIYWKIWTRLPPLSSFVQQ